jgi:Bacterial PH domain
MKKLFKSKIGLELVIPLTMIFGIVLFLTMRAEPGYLGIAILLPVILIVHLFMTTNYTVEGDSLTIQCGVFYNKTIAIKEIRKITETNDPISSPATSLDRLEIVYGKSDRVLISPQLKKEFIDTIVSLHPSVEVKLKKK